MVVILLQTLLESEPAFDPELIKRIPTKKHKLMEHLHNRIKKRLLLIAEIFKKYFINRKKHIKEKELLFILKPIIVN